MEPMPQPPDGFAACRVFDGHVQTSHLVVSTGRAGTPGRTLCNLTRFDDRDADYGVIRPADLPGWSINGGTYGDDVEQVECPACWEFAASDIGQTVALAIRADCEAGRPVWRVHHDDIHDWTPGRFGPVVFPNVPARLQALVSAGPELCRDMAAEILRLNAELRAVTQQLVDGEAALYEVLPQSTVYDLAEMGYTLARRREETNDG